jgi:hypothetical protein
MNAPAVQPKATMHLVATLRRGRAIHLVDLENLMGTPSPVPGLAAQTCDRYRAFIETGDHVVVATSHSTARTASFELPRTGIRLVVRSSAGGADFALLDTLDLHHVALLRACELHSHLNLTTRTRNDLAAAVA